MLDLEEARIERETSKMDFRRLCEQVHFFSRRSQKNPEDTMPSASLLRSSRTLPPVTFSPRRATTRFSRHPVRAFKEGARCFVLLRELAIRERAGGDDAATGQKRGFHVFFSPLGHVSLSLAPPQGTTSVHGTTFPLRFYACTLDVDRLFLRERKLETKRTLTIDLPSSLFFFDADEKPKKKKKPERSFFASTAAAPTSSSSARCRFPEQQQQHRPDPDPLLDPRRRQRPHPRLRGRPRPGPPGERERVFFFFFKEKKKKKREPPLTKKTRPSNNHSKKKKTLQRASTTEATSSAGPSSPSWPRRTSPGRRRRSSPTRERRPRSGRKSLTKSHSSTLGPRATSFCGRSPPWGSRGARSRSCGTSPRS